MVQTTSIPAGFEARHWCGLSNAWVRDFPQHRVVVMDADTVNAPTESTTRFSASVFSEGGEELAAAVLKSPDDVLDWSLVKVEWLEAHRC